MNRFVAYPDTSSGSIVVDTLSNRIVALYRDRPAAERAAVRLNARSLIAARPDVPRYEGAINLQDVNAVSEPLPSDDGLTGRVFRSAKDIADSILERRLHGRQ
jgi:hypothetical protein